MQLCTNMAYAVSDMMLAGVMQLRQQPACHKVAAHGSTTTDINKAITGNTFATCYHTMHSTANHLVKTYFQDAHIYHLQSLCMPTTHCMPVTAYETYKRSADCQVQNFVSVHIT